MNRSNPESVTQLLVAAGRGEVGAGDRLWTVVYEELRRLARHQLASEDRGAFESTALIHEAYLRLIGNEPVEWVNRRHFFAAAARAMRHIRIDDARRRRRIKRGGDLQASPVSDEMVVSDDDTGEMLAIDEALKKLEQVAPRQAEIVMLRYFGGLSVDETAQAIDVSPRTVDYEWRLARAWLHRELKRGDTKVD